MATIKNFQNLDICQNSIKLAYELYDLCKISFVRKDFFFKDQLKRASLSISNNTAEGFEYNNNTHFEKFLRYAKGSCGGCRRMIGFMKTKNWITNKQYNHFYPQLKNIGAQIGSFKSYLKKSTPHKNKEI